MSVPTALLELAEAQRGLLGRHQMCAHLTEHVVDDLLRSGWFRRAERGVYRLPGGPRGPEVAAFAAALRARPRATVSGPVVLRLLKVPSFLDAEAFEILTAPQRRLRRVAFTHRADPDPDRPVARHGEVRVTAPLDALVHSAGWDVATDRDLRVAWDHLRGRGLVAVDRLERRLAAPPPADVPAAQRLGDVLQRGGGASVESEGERWLWPFLSCYDPCPAPQRWITRNRRADFACDRCRLAFEYLGEVDHAYLAQRIADDERDDELRDAGYRVRYVTKHDVAEPVTLLASLTATMVARAHELGVPPPRVVRQLDVAALRAR